MESLRVLKETLDYVRQFRGKTIILKISKIVLANSMKLTNVIKDIILLRNSEINVVVTHSESQFKRDPWLGLEPVIFLDIATISGVENQIALGILPVVFFDETLPLSSEKAITSLAIKLGAAKIIYITNYDGIFQSGSLISEMNVERAREILSLSGVVTREMRKRVEVALIACKQGIPRVHIIGSREGSLIKEILTCHGSGTMIYESFYRGIREPKETDVAEIFGIIKESIKTASVPLEFIKEKLSDFWVFAIDQQIQGCLQIDENPHELIGEIAYLSMLPGQEDPLIFKHLIEHGLERMSPEIEYVFLDPEKNTNLLGMYPWFKQLGFAKSSLNEYGIEINRGNKMWIKKTK